MTQQNSLTAEQEEMNKKISQQLQSIPVLEKNITILENDNKQQRSQLASAAVRIDQDAKYIQSLEQQVQEATETNSKAQQPSEPEKDAE